MPTVLARSLSPMNCSVYALQSIFDPAHPANTTLTYCRDKKNPGSKQY